MSTAHRYIPHYTIADYEQWDGDWELWQGIPVSMSPSPFGPHQDCCLRIARALLTSMEAAQCDAVVLQEIDWIISDDTIVRPDILAVCGGVPKRHVTEAPALIVEILSDGTAHRGRNAKLSLYQDHGVCYYLIVNPNEFTVEAHQRNEEGQFERMTHLDGYEFVLCGNCRVQPNLQFLRSRSE